MASSFGVSSSLLYASDIDHQVYDPATAGYDFKEYTDVWIQLPPHPTDLSNLNRSLIKRQETSPIRVHLLEHVHKRRKGKAPRLCDWNMTTAAFGSKPGRSSLTRKYLSWNELGFQAPLGARTRCHWLVNDCDRELPEDEANSGASAAGESLTSPLVDQTHGESLISLVGLVGSPNTTSDHTLRPVGFKPDGAQRVPDQITCATRTACDYQNTGQACNSSEDRSVDTNEELQEQAFPTDAAERKRNAKNAAKERGEEWVTVKRPKHVEEHYDDCGEDLSAILWCNYSTDEDSSASESGLSDEDGIMQFAFFGPGQEGLPDVPSTTEIAANIEQLFAILERQE